MRTRGGEDVWELSGLEMQSSVFLSLCVIQIICPGKSRVGQWKSVRSTSGDK